jgi:hypothetical protein
LQLSVNLNIPGRNLIPITKSGGAEPVVSAALANDITGKAIPNEDFTCATKGKSVNPTWGEKFHFGKNFNLAIDSSRLPTLHVTVMDHSKKAPMGMVELPLRENQEDCDSWFTLQKFGSMAAVSGDIHLSFKWRNPQPSTLLPAPLAPGASARNSLQALGGGGVVGGSGGAGAVAGAGAGGASSNSGFLTDGPAANPEYADQPPNELRIVCIQGKNLLAMDQAYLYGQSTSDPYVYIKVGNDSKQTKYLPKTLNPVWMETLVLEDVTDLTKTCEVIVFDYDLNGSDFMGKVRLPLRQYADKQPVRRWFKLGNTGGDFDHTPRGEVELQVTWHFNPQLLAKKKKTSILQAARDMGAMIITKVESDEDDDDEGNPQMSPPKTEEEIKAEEEAKAKAEEEEKEKRGGIELKDGDYQVQVHIIEARDLKAENLDGTSDPTVFVECFDQKQNTKTIYQKLNCVFDDVLIFNFKHLAKETVEDGIIRITVMDANSVPGLKSTMIGAYTFDATTVYFSPSHEIHRKWVALMDDEDPDDVGVQGYLKVSVQIIGSKYYHEYHVSELKTKFLICTIGPGDKLTIHNEEEDLKKEQEAAARAGGDDVGSMVMMPPSIKREWKWAVMTVYRAEALPIMDVVGTMGTDAFLTLEMGGGKPAFTKVVTVKGRSQKDMNPEFFQELWVPVSCPTATQVIKATVWDSNTLPPHQFIATFTHRWNIIEKLEMRQTGMHWVNLYGAPEYKNTASMTEMLVKGVRRVTAKVQSAVVAEKDPKDLYNFTPDKASQFKGRVLVNVRIEDRPPEKYKDKKEPFHRKFSKKQVTEPASKRYFLKVLAIMGSEIPVKSASTSEVCLRIGIGQDLLITKPARCLNGLISWDEELVLDELDLPSAPSQVPDIFLYICAKNSQVAYSFTRLKSQDLIAGRFMIPAKWYTLQEDKVVNSINDGEFPGQVLLKIGLGSPEDANFALDEWQNALQDVREKSYFVVRVHVYQARDIEAADSNGLSDPYIIVKIAGQEKQTETRYKTLYPTYYQVFDFDDCQLSNLREYMPPVSFVLWDYDIDGSDYLGTAHFNMNNAYMHGLDTEKEPSWIPFFKEEMGDSEGEILVKVEIFRKDDPSMKLQDMYEKGLIPAEFKDPSTLSTEERNAISGGGMKRPSLLNKLGGAMTSMVTKKETGWGPPDIHPETYEAWIEVIVLGLRNLAPYNFQAVQNPFLELIVENVDGTKQKTCTRNSKKPSPANPNFLEKLTIPVKLPRNPMFAQPMFLEVKDIRLGGYMKPLIASGVVKMDEKIPGSPNYKPPGKQSFYRANEDRGKNEDEDTGPKSSGIELTSEGIQGGSSSGDVLVPNIDDLRASATKDETYYKLQKKMDARSAELAQDPLIASANPMDLKGFINDRKAKEDSGAGIFGALQHVDLDEIEEIRKKRGYGDDDALVFDDEEDMEPKWRKNRTILSGELESELQTTPFETYKLYRGKKSSILGRKVVGILKGLIRVRLTNNPNDTCFEKGLLEQLQKPQAYKIRLYVLEAKGLTPMDRDMFGKPAKSDPYLKVELGSFKFNDRENAVDDVVEVDFYKVIEMDTELPGTSQLTVHVMDKNLVGYDQLIGSTVIDLEDRWFDSRWQELGKQFREMPGDNGVNSGRWDPKPVEKRTLYVPSNNVSQGVIELWVDILEPAVAGSFPAEDVALPPKKMFELRVVIWKVRNVPAADTFENMSDLFVKAWPEGCEPLETDTHWYLHISLLFFFYTKVLEQYFQYCRRAKKGKGSFNWRLLFDVELGHNTRLSIILFLFEF